VFLRQTLLYLPAQVVGPVFQFLAVIAWTFWLAPAELGQLNLVIAMQELLFLPTLYWWSHYTLRSFDRHLADGTRDRFEKMELLVMAGGIAANAVLMFVSVLAFIDSKASAGFLAAAVAYSVTRSILMVLVERTRAVQQIGIYTVLQVAASAAGLIIGLTLVWRFGNSAIWPLLGFSAAQALAVLYVVPRIGLVWQKPTLDRDILRGAMRYGAPLMLAAAITWISLYGQRFIIDALLGRAEVGLYSVGAGIADRSLMFIAFLVAPAVFPLAIRDVREVGMERAMARLSDGLGLGLILLIPAVVGIAVLAGPIAKLLLGEAYQATAAALLPAAALAAGLHAAWTLMPAQTLLLHERTEFNVGIETVGAVVSIVLGLLLVRSHGVLGAAYARVAASLFVVALGVGISIKVFRAQYPWWIILGAVLSAVVMALVLRALPPPTSLIGLAGQIALGAVVYGLTVGVLFRQRIRDVLDRAGILQKLGLS
jgi:O-antigen/teichoic acid export membrane protein